MMIPAWYDSKITFYSVLCTTIMGVVGIQLNDSMIYKTFTWMYSISLTYSYLYDSVYTNIRPLVLSSIIPANIALLFTNDVITYGTIRGVSLAICIATARFIDFKNVLCGEYDTKSNTI